MTRFCLLLIISALSSVNAQVKPAKWSGHIDLHSNGLRDWEQLTGSGLYDRTRTSAGSAVELNHVLFTNGTIEWVLGARYSLIRYHSSYVDTAFRGWPAALSDWKKENLGTLHGFSLQSGLSYLTPRSEEDGWQTGFQAMLVYTHFQFRGSSEFQALPFSLGLRLALLARYDFLEISPYLYIQNDPAVVRSYAWEVPYKTGDPPTVVGSAISRHGRYQLGLRFGIRF